MENETDIHKGERIAKLLARAGVGSRRAVERMIEAGMVEINGKTVDSPATLIHSVDGITVDGEKVAPLEPTQLWLYHKPAGRLTTYYDPEGRPTIFEAMPENMPRVISVGRLDLNTEGLLLLTNDGALTRWLELPSTGWIRTYRVRVNGRFHPKRLEEITKGVTIDEVSYRSVEIELDPRKEGVNQWLTIKIKEGKNREVRKLLEYAGLTVNRLLRTSYGPFELRTLERGRVEAISNVDLTSKCKDFFKGINPEIIIPDIQPKKKTKGEGWAKSKPKKHIKPKNNKRSKERIDIKGSDDTLRKKRYNKPTKNNNLGQKRK